MNVQEDILTVKGVLQWRMMKMKNSKEGYAVAEYYKNGKFKSFRCVSHERFGDERQ